MILVFVVLCSPALFYDTFKERFGDGSASGRNPINPCVGTFRSDDRQGDSPYWEVTKNTNVDDPASPECWTPEPEEEAEECEEGEDCEVEEE